MSKPITIPKGAPKHICAELVHVAEQEQRNETRWLDKLQERLDEGSITQGDADRELSAHPEPASRELFAYCAGNCLAGTCAMKGFGVELVGADYDSLDPADKERFDFYAEVDTVGYISKVTLGVNLF
jgi:hypothetical protein